MAPTENEKKTAQEKGTDNKEIEFMMLMGSLKHLKRTGWIMKDVPEPETVSGHMYRMASLTFLLDENDKVDIEKVRDMCLVHDMGESIIGDITPDCGIPQEEKVEKETKAIKYIAGLVPEKSGKAIYDLFMEYENQSTPEARLVKDLDKFDFMLQAFEYEKRDGKPGGHEAFITSTQDFFTHPKVIEWAKTVKEMRLKTMSE